MKARAVIGASFGDEGKGLLVDWFCARGDASVVVRFSGGAQAGHTVVTPEGQRHVFRQLGCGHFSGVPTFLSSFVLVNPIMILMELEALSKLGLTPEVYASPECHVTTFADVIVNRRLEERRGAGRHGSCGMGIGETVERGRIESLRITMADLYDHANLESKLAEICDEYARFRTGEPIDEPEKMVGFLKACERLPEVVFPAGIAECEDPIFEGTQGLLLSQDNREFFPHVSRSRTGASNVRELCALMGIAEDEVEAWYVTRTYLTRHGAGPLPGEDDSLSYEDDTNSENAWQGRLRFAPLDVSARLALNHRIALDAGGMVARRFVTHRDQLALPELVGDLESWGPCRSDVRGP